MITIEVHALSALATDIFRAAGATPENAAVVVSSLVDANLTGHDSHGVIRIPSYIIEIREGRLDPKASPVVIQETASSAIVDGAATFGQVGSRLAADVAISKARDAGLAAVAAMHCGHTGRIGEWVERVANAGLVGIATNATVRGPQSVAPYGGARGALGTNPIAWAIPRAEGRPPILLDYATSAAAAGKLMVARAKQAPLPEGWILNAAGEPTTNVEDYFAGGLLLPFAGHKGYALSVVIEMMTIGLSGGERVPPGGRASCLCLLAINPAVFRPLDEFTAYVESVAARLKSIPPAPGFEEVLLPGEPETRARAARSRSGIPLPERTWTAIQVTARELGVA